MQAWILMEVYFARKNIRVRKLKGAEHMHSFKVITSIFLLLAIIIGTGIFSTRILASTSDKLQQQIAEVENSIASENWEKAEESIKNVEINWKKTEKTWAILLDHFEIDQIDNTLSRLTKYIETQDKPLALAEAEAMKKYVEHIPEKETLRMKNVL